MQSKFKPKANITTTFSEFQASRFNGKDSAYIVLALHHTINIDLTVVKINEDIAARVFRLFRNKLSQFYFGNASKRYGEKLVITCNFDNCPHWHLHIQAEIPERGSLAEVEKFTRQFAIENEWLYPDPHVSTTRSNLKSQIYNNRYGLDTVIL